MSESHFELLNAIADPLATALDPDQLETALGITAPPSRQQALQVLEDEFLKPVKGVEKDKLWRWQM